MISDLTRKYWIDILLGWAEDRLLPPQLDECRAALDFTELVAAAVEVERLADARAVCPRCAAGAEAYYDAGLKDWYHQDKQSIISARTWCLAANIWERGRVELVQSVDDEIARWSDQEFFGEEPVSETQSEARQVHGPEIDL